MYKSLTKHSIKLFVLQNILLFYREVGNDTNVSLKTILLIRHFEDRTHYQVSPNSKEMMVNYYGIEMKIYICLTSCKGNASENISSCINF